MGCCAVLAADARTGGDLDGSDHGEDGDEGLEGHGRRPEMLLEEAWSFEE